MAIQRIEKMGVFSNQVLAFFVKSVLQAGFRTQVLKILSRNEKHCQFQEPDPTTTDVDFALAFITLIWGGGRGASPISELGLVSYACARTSTVHAAMNK